jgi:predicted O-methyltransferase YrrM
MKFVIMIKNQKKHFDDKIMSAFGLTLFAVKEHLDSSRVAFGMSLSVEVDSSLRLDRTQELLFAAISLARKDGVRSILEFGTFAGESTLVLRALFPSAEITTIDLPEPLLTGADSASEIERIKDIRSKNIKKAGAKLILKDSALISPRDLDVYDLVWLDGDHTYPVVVVDVVNALHCLNENGILIMDDICRHVSITNLILRRYLSTDSWDAVKKLSKIYGLVFELFPKRLNFSQYLPGRRREMALIKKVTAATGSGGVDSKWL